MFHLWYYMARYHYGNRENIKQGLLTSSIGAPVIK